MNTQKIREFYFKKDEEPPILVKLSSPKTAEEIQELDIEFLIKNTKRVQESQYSRDRYLLKTVFQLKKDVKELNERLKELEKEKYPRVK